MNPDLMHTWKVHAIYAQHEDHLVDDLLVEPSQGWYYGRGYPEVTSSQARTYDTTLKGEYNVDINPHDAPNISRAYLYAVPR